MSLEVYINERLIDLKSAKNIGLSFQVGSILKPGTRAGNLSNSFSVPKTRNNTEILGTILNINSNTNIPYQRNSAKIVQDGLEVFPDGFAIVEAAGKDYSITVYSGNVSFFDLIKGKNVSELDFFSSNHIFNITNIINSFTAGLDYIYPIIDYGKDIDLLNNSLLQYADALLPSVKLKPLLEKIFTAVNYELKGTFLDYQQYERLIVTPNQFGLSQDQLDDINGYAGDVTPDTTIVPVISIANGGIGNVFVNIPLVYNLFTQTTFAGVNFIPSSRVYGKLKFFCYVAIQTAPGYSTSPITPAMTPGEMILYKDGSPIASQIFNTTGSFPNTILVNFSLETANIIVEPTSIYSVEFSIDAVRHATVDYTLSSVLSLSSFTFEAQKVIPYGTEILFNTLYNVDQTKILKDVLNQYRLLMQTNEITKQVFLNPLDDLQDNIPIAKDWSSKINLKSTPKIKFQLPGYAQLNYLKYADDDDVDINVGRGSFTIDDYNLTEEKDLIKLNAAAVVKELRVDNEETPTIPFQEIYGDHFDNKKNRFLLLDPKNKVVDFQTSVNSDTGQASADIPFCYFQKDGKVDSLDFTNLINENYKVLLGMVDKSKLVTASFNLNAVDIQNLDFTIPIFLDIHSSEIHINGYFYINKISNFKSNSPTNVQLIRL